MRTRIWRHALCVCLAAVLTAAGCSLVGRAGPSRPEPVRGPAPSVVVSLTFNDGWVSQYEYAAPLLAAHRMPATFFVVSGWIGQRLPCCMAWWQLDELYRAGHEIGGMGLQHEDLTRPGPGPWPSQRARLSRQVCQDRQLLADRGYDPRGFAYPGGAFVTSFADGSTPQDLVRGCGYGYARAVGGLVRPGGRAALSLPPPDPYGLRTPDVQGRGPVQLADLTRPVTAAARRGGGWVPIALDRVCHRGSRLYAACMASPRPITDTTLAAFLDWLAAPGRPGGAPGGTVVRTVRAALGAPPQPPLAPRSTTVSLTFDDGSRSQYALRPILLDRGMRATFYINSGLVDRNDGSAMSWAQLRGLAGDGNDVGGHTLSHRDLLRLPPAERRREVCEDRDRLVANGLPPVSFAYPYGQFDLDVQRLVRSCGYRSARTSGTILPVGPRFAEDLPPADPYATLALGAESEGPLRLSYLQSGVRMAAARGGGWLQIIIHQVCQRSQRGFGACMRSHRPVELGVLVDFLDWLRDGAPPATAVKTVRDVLDAG
ncbi:MAG TPA: polysaccharide deacetylase family protein [Mycobacteriales bacterium]